MSLGKKVFSSTLLLFVRKIWANLINLFVMSVLARVLDKEDFGLLAISSVFLGIINTVATSGISEYIIYYDGEDRREKLNAAFWLNFLMTLGVVLVAILAGPFWADFYGNEKVYYLLLLLSIAFFFEMGSTVPRSILRKNLEYKTLVLYSGVAMTLISVGKLVGAWSGFGVYSLALPQAVVSPLLMISFFLRTRWTPFLKMGISHFKPIFSYSRHIIGGRILTKFVNEGDNLIVGKFLGLEALGVYSLAFQLANLVSTNVIAVASDIFLPVFSKVKSDMQKLGSVYLKMIRFLSFISFPLITTLAFLAKPIIMIVYGPKWIDAIVPFQILCLFALTRSVSSPSSSLFGAMGRPDINFKFALAFTPVFLLAVALSSNFGIITVAATTTIVRVVASVISLYLSLRLIHMNLGNLLSVIKSNVVSTLLLILFLCPLYLYVADNAVTILIFGPFVFYSHVLMQRVLFARDIKSFILELSSNWPISLIKTPLEKVLFMKPLLR